MIDVHRDEIFVRHGGYWTSAGVTAGIDMALGMVEVDLGRDLAMDVAKKLVVFYKRPGGQSQFSTALLEQSSGDERIAALNSWIDKNIARSFKVEDMAEHVGLTPRTFARFYRERTGLTPAAAVERMRIERACRLIESRQLLMKSLAQQCGFGSDEVMRRAFIRQLGVSPSEYRQRFSAS